ncbi:MAG: hypothetical protein RSB09_04880 [Clostridia bacterium]
MELKDAPKKNVRVTMTDGELFVGPCTGYTSAEDNEYDENIPIASIFITKGPHFCFELYENEIAKIEEI